ncbi:MAG TPA: endonuclease domain-containing protein [Longimicrobium sp.]|nr:endonuclease domain-containing protein [Longimicrobium sp.]
MTQRPIRRIRAPILAGAKEHRQDPTSAEAVLWSALRRQQLGGLPFRRQHPVGRFILDFYCPRKKLCVELDGSSHDGREADDQARTDALALLKIHVVRFRNDEVLQDLPSVLRRIEEVVSQCSSPPLRT